MIQSLINILYMLYMLYFYQPFKTPSWGNASSKYPLVVSPGHNPPFEADELPSHEWIFFSQDDLPQGNRPSTTVANDQRPTIKATIDKASHNRDWTIMNQPMSTSGHPKKGCLSTPPIIHQASSTLQGDSRFGKGELVEHSCQGASGGHGRFVSVAEVFG